MRCVITAPKRFITGAFNILFSFPEEVSLTVDDFRIETLWGDDLGDPRDNLKGGGRHWSFQCYIPENRYGRSRVTLAMLGYSAFPADVMYDTIRSVQIQWGTPILTERTIEIPVWFDYPLQHLRKRNFRISGVGQFQIYRTDGEYLLVIQKRDVGFSVTALGQVVKINGVQAYITESVLEV